MSKLQEVKMNKAIEYGKQMKSERSKLDYEDGFDDCLALDLPVKFALWYNSKEASFKDWRRKVYWIVGEEGVKTAYEYWIDNVYKPE